MAITGDRTKIKLGPQQITFKGTDLGFTEGGVEVIYTARYREIMVDQLGTLVDVRLIGEDIEMKFALAETSRANLLIAMPAASAATGAASAAGIDVGRRPGYGIVTAASGILIVHPEELDAADKSRDWTVPISVPIGPINIPMKADEEQLIPLHFKGIADPSQADGHHLFRYGY